MTVLGVQDFTEAFRVHFAIEDEVAPTAGLFDELGFDSLAVLRLMVWTEDLAGVLYAEEEPEAFFDLQGAYNHYCRLARQSEGRYPV